MASSQATIAQKTWEMSNKIMEVNASEEIYKYDKAQQQSMLTAKPWEKDPHFFKEIKISGNLFSFLVYLLKILNRWGFG